MPAPAVHVVSSAHHVADARLSRIADALERQGATVTVCAVGEPQKARGFSPSWSAHVSPRGRMANRLGRAMRSGLGPPADVLVVLDLDLVLPALVWRRRTGGAVVADVHEDYRAVLRDRAWSRGPLRLLLEALVRAAIWGAARADLTVVADDHVPPLHARNRLVVRNLPAAGEIPPAGQWTWPPRAVYVGDIRRSRGLHAMVGAVLAVPPWELDLIGPVATADRRWLDGRVASAGGRIRRHGRLPLEQAWQAVEGAAAGLLLLDPTPAFSAAVPTKLYEYLLAGLAIIATPLPRVEEIIRRAGAGAIASDPHTVQATLRRWLHDSEELDRCRSDARGWASRHLPTESPFDHLAVRVTTLAGPRPGTRRRLRRAG